MPLSWVSLCLCPNRHLYHNDVHQSLILRGYTSTEFLRMQNFLSGLARILRLQERTGSCPHALARRSHMLSEIHKLSFLHVLASVVLVIGSL
jgi:hypothetical protein